MCGLRKWLTKRINDLEEDNELGKVIKGPWKETPVKQLDEVKSELEMKKEFAETSEIEEFNALDKSNLSAAISTHETEP